ncbi:BppU family phage baseplate upper protein [Limosilactobacillus reuteri]|uniref:BppU family phage baseplate upper protein n=1 Tax=Limosilactobacillus reuteri TaxID=1598 RepID=UPI001EE6D3AE|nr:BppU family phage baseplate upper protein [Limosilactobacillus reuteri]
MSQTLTYVIGQDRRPHVDNVQDFKVNFDGSNTNWVQARQYERSMRQVFVNIKNEDGTPLDLTGCNVWFEGLLPKNSAGDFRVIDDKGYVALDPTAGRFRFDMPGHAFTVAGSYRQAFFRIVKDGNSITTLEFDLDVLADKVIDGLVPRTYISPVEELINEIETKYQDSTDKLTKMTSDFVDQFTQSMNTLKALGVTVQNGLDALEAKIKQDGLFTQAEADAFKQKIQEQLDKALTKVDEKLASIFGKGQNPVALSVYWTNWDNDKRQYTQFSVDQMKTSIDVAANYVQGIVVPLRLENDGNQFHVLGNLADIKQGIDYATSKGLKLMGIKIHCVATLEQINNYGMDNFFNDYANSVSATCTSLSLTTDTKLTILNERWDLVNDKTYADKVVKLINDLKTATKLSVGISFVQQYLGDAQSSVYSACDFIGLNAYPTVTDLKRSVPFALIASAWQQVAPIIQSLIALYHKPIFLSETGIEDNYEALEDPSNWKVGSQYNSQGEVQYMYFKGLFASGILDYTSAVWIWFGVTSTKAQALIRQYANGVIN